MKNKLKKIMYVLYYEIFCTADDCTACAEVSKPTLPMTPHARRSRTLSVFGANSRDWEIKPLGSGDDLMLFDSPVQGNSSFYTNIPNSVLNPNYYSLFSTSTGSKIVSECKERMRNLLFKKIIKGSLFLYPTKQNKVEYLVRKSENFLPFDK